MGRATDRRHERGLLGEFGDEYLGLADAGATIASGMVAEPIAGLAGLLGTALPGDEGQGAAWVGDVQDALTWEPKTEEGRRNLGYLGEGIEAVADYEGLLGGPSTNDMMDYYNDETVPAAQYLLGDEAGAALGAGGAAMAGVGLPGRARSTIRGAQRKAYPGVYKPVNELLEDVNVAPESGNLPRLFDTTRSELASVADRPGNIPALLPGAAANPKGSAAAGPVMGRANTARLRDNLEAVRGTDLEQGMKGWYVMDPMFQRTLELVGGDMEEAKRRYTQLNTLSGMASPGSDVITEINRGSTANYMANQGRFDDFMTRAGLPEGHPNKLPQTAGHPYHKTAQGGPMQGYLESGEVQLKSPKVPLYIDASGTPETGFQTEYPVGDAHWSRGVGLADTRTNKAFGASYSNPEAAQLGPWWRDEVAGAAGYESVPGQAISWGLYGPQTGVETPVGAPKLELWADEIYRDAMERRMSPELLRDRILLGEDRVRR